MFFYTHPVFLALLAHYFLPGDALSFDKLCGVIFAMIGVIVLDLPQLRMGHSSTALGDLLVLSGALATAVQNLIIKRAAGTIPPVALVFWGTVAATLLLGIGWWEFERDTTFLFSARAITSVLYLSLISAAFGFVAFAWLLQHHSATRVTALVFLAPGFGVLFAWVLLREPMTGLQLLGVWEVCGGLCLVSTASSRED